MRQERVIKLSWGRYTFPDSPALEETGQFFEKFLKNSSQPIRANTGNMELHPTEKNILVDILSKDNRYLQLSERELARRNNISRYKVKKYTHKLEKKRLITIEKEGKQLIYTPTQVAINAFSAFLHSEKTGSKIDSSSSKVQPITSKKWPIINGKGEVGGKDVLQDQFSPDVPEDVGHQGMPSALGTPENEYLAQDTAPEDSGRPDTPPQNVQTFEDYIAWQQKNAHRLIIQFKLLRCNHNRLKGTGWIFGKKSIHKHFTFTFHLPFFFPFLGGLQRLTNEGNGFCSPKKCLNWTSAHIGYYPFHPLRRRRLRYCTPLAHFSSFICMGREISLPPHEGGERSVLNGIYSVF